MVTLSTRTRRVDGVTLVACRLHNGAAEPRVAVVDARVDGPVNGPGKESVQNGTLRVTVPGGETVGTGFSTPAEPDSAEPAVLVDERASDGERPASAVLTELSDPRPPHDAVVGVENTEGSEPPSDSARRDTASDGDEVTLDAVEDRIERLAAVAAATAVPDAADALAAEGGLDAVRELDSQVRTDRERLLELADRATTLAARAEAVEPRLDALERLS